jgi:cell division protein FtsQ
VSVAAGASGARAEHFRHTRFRLGRPRVRTVFKAFVFLVGAVAFFAGLLQTQIFRVERIDVVGTSHLTPQQVLEVANLQAGGSIATVDMSGAERRLETHPWILRARVETNWPHVVRVVVTEQRAVAIAETQDKKWAQLGPDGTVLAVGPTPTANLPTVLGVRAPSAPGLHVDQTAKTLMDVATAMPASLQPLVLQMQDQGGVLRLGLDAGTVVVLGNASDIGEKLMSVAAVLAHTEAKTIASLDVSSPRFPIAVPVETQSSTARSGASDSGSSGASGTSSTTTPSTSSSKTKNSGTGSTGSSTGASAGTSETQTSRKGTSSDSSTGTSSATSTPRKTTTTTVL